MDTTKALTQLLPEALSQLDGADFEIIPSSLHAMGRPKFYALLNALVQCIGEDEVYLEVGCYQGGSLIGAMLNQKHKRAVAVDNFSEFPPENNNLKILTENIHKFNLEGAIEVHDKGYRDYFALRPTIKAGVYYYDGAHNARDTFQGLLTGFPYVAEGGLMVLDDTLYPDVNIGINWFLKERPREVVVVSAVAVPSEFNSFWWNGTTILMKMTGKPIWRLEQP